MKYLPSFLLGALVLSACSSSAPSRTATGGSGGDEETGGSGGPSTGTGGKTATGGASGTGGKTATGGSTGTGGDTATGGSGGGGGPTDPDGGASDARASVDMAAAADAEPKLEECPKPSIDRITAWNATGEGTTKPMSGSLLVKEGDHYVARQEFVGGDWHVLEVFIGNTFEFMVDLSKSAGFTLTYSSTNDLWLQLRPAFHYDGGAQWVTKIPSTAGKMVTQTFSFDPSKWVTIDLGKPTWTYDMARKAARGFLFVGDKPNIIAFQGLRIDGYVPVCR
jgi:hypothetical protein